MTLSSVSAKPSASENALLVSSAHPRRVVLVAITTVVVVIALGFSLRVVPLDVAFSRAMHHLHVSALTSAAEAFYRALKPASTAVIMAVVTVVLGLVTRRWQVAAAFLGTIAVTWVLAEASKLIVDRPRPGVSEAVVQAVGANADASFPSGHVAFTASLAAALICVLWTTRWRLVGIVVGVVLVVGMSVSVVVVGVHYAGDAVGSILWVAGVFPAVRAGWAMVIVPWAERAAQRAFSSRRS